MFSISMFCNLFLSVLCPEIDLSGPEVNEAVYIVGSVWPDWKTAAQHEIS